MKAIRSLAAALALLAPVAGMAQTPRPFQNSWFWGLKGGGMVTSSPSKSNVTAAMAGVDWLITRDRGGLYVSLDQSFLSQSAVLADSVNPSDTPGVVNLKNLRRLSMMLMGFPGDANARVHPYVGLGMIYNQVGQIQRQTAYGSQQQYDLAQQIMSQYKSVFTPAVMVGGQMEYRSAAVFVQAMGWQANQNFFLSSKTRGFNASLEFGLRYNFGSSISQDR